jgi:hypothetical protein
VAQILGFAIAPAGFGSVPIDNGQQTLNTEDRQIDPNKVQDTSGRAAELSGSGAVVVDGGLGFLNATGNETGTATFLTHVAIDDPSRTQVIFQLGDEYQLSYNGTSNEYELWYFDEETRDTYLVNVSAPSDPTPLQPVIFTRDGETLTLINAAGEGLQASVTTTGDSFEPLPTDQGLDGRLEETRVINRTVTSSETTIYTDDKIAPVAVGNRESRLMYDTQGSGVAVDFRDNASASLTGDAQRGDGIPGDSLSSGTDFAITSSGSNQQTISALVGGQLEDMPRVFLGGATNDSQQLLELLRVAFSLAGLALLVIVIRRLFKRAQELTQG